MPLEIKELQISITVNQQPNNGAAPPQSGGGNGKDDVKKCIEAVLEVIQNKRER
jgi:hypothetical protein